MVSRRGSRAVTRRRAIPAAPVVGAFKPGMYMGWNQAAAITTWETDNSITIPYGHEFGDQVSWASFTNGTNFTAWDTWVAAKAGRRFTYSAPLLTVNDDSGLTKAQKYAALAAGTYDSNFTSLGNAFQAKTNLRNAIVRLGWEFNGNSRAWAVPPNDQTTLDNYKTGFNRAAAALKAACPTLEIEWCPNCQPDYTLRTFAAMYPGNTNIDYIGIGLYDYYWPGGTPTQAQRESWLINGDTYNGLADQVALAQANGKKLAHTEWGLWQSSTTGGGGDRPAFIDLMADWYQTYGYSYHVYNNTTSDGGHRLDVYPNAKARFLARFGSLSTRTRADVGTLIANWKASDLDDSLTSGAAVATWADRSATPRNLTQATTASQPTLVKNVLNGKSVVRFDDVDDFLGVTVAAATPQPWTVIVVAKANTLDGQLFGSSDGAVDVRIGSPSRILWAGTANLTGGTYTAGTWEIQMYHAEGASSSIATNGVRTTGTAGVNSIGVGWQVGRLAGATPGRYLGGDIAEILIYTGTWSTTQQAQLGSLLQAEYGITVADYTTA